MVAKKKTAKKVAKKKVTAKKMTRKKVFAKKEASEKSSTAKDILAAAKLLGQIETNPWRPTLYREEFCQQLVDYFNIEPYREVEKVHSKTGAIYHTNEANRLPTVAGFGNSIGVSRATLYSWAKKHPNFQEAMDRCQSISEDILVTNGLLGLYDPRVMIMVGKNYTSLRDVKETMDLSPPSAPESPDDIQKRIDFLANKIKRLKAQL